jgi:hypothetical protein
MSKSTTQDEIRVQVSALIEGLHRYVNRPGALSELLTKAASGSPEVGTEIERVAAQANLIVGSLTPFILDESGCIDRDSVKDIKAVSGCLNRIIKQAENLHDKPSADFGGLRDGLAAAVDSLRERWLWVDPAKPHLRRWDETDESYMPVSVYCDVATSILGVNGVTTETTKNNCIRQMVNGRRRRIHKADADRIFGVRLHDAFAIMAELVKGGDLDLREVRQSASSRAAKSG